MNTIENWGGGENWHFKTAIYLLNRGYSIFFILNKNSVLDKKLQNYPEIQRIYIKFKKFSYLNPIIHYSLYKAFQKNKINIVIFNSIRDTNSASISAKIAGVKRRIFRYGSSKPLKKKLLTYLSLRYNLTDIFANSQALKEKLIQIKFIDDKKVDVLYNYVKIEEIPKKTAKYPITLGVSSRLVFNKGFKPMLKSIYQIKDKEFKVAIAGTGKDREKIEEIIEEYQLNNHIEMRGFIEDIGSFYKDIDILLHFSYEDGTSNSILEAMSHKLPIIAFNQSSYPEMVTNRYNGFLVQADNIKEMKEAIESFIDNPSLIEEMGEASFQIVKDKFKESKILDTFIERYIK
jgi:glycosyltransferase involved in cell wall biosynthesis